MPKIRFQSKLTAIGSQTILRLPEAASRKLPSRGMSVVEGTFSGHAFQAPLEPDGMGSHWLRVSNRMLKAARAEVGDSVSVALEPMAPWPAPKVPVDLAEALASDPQARRLEQTSTYLNVARTGLRESMRKFDESVAPCKTVAIQTLAGHPPVCNDAPENVAQALVN
jgi:hypothetical protein